MNSKLKYLTSILLYLSLVLFIFTFSISLPIYIRPFYFLHIDAYELEEATGLTNAEIKHAYNDMLDYLTLPGKEFSLGGLNFSDSGKAHFEDCKKLFSLNFFVLLASTLSIVILFIKYKKNISKLRLLRLPPAIWSGLTSITLPLALVVPVSMFPDRSFTIFHKIFFPGKDNWLFDYRTDEIINILPSEFFMNCAALIGTSIFLLSIALILATIISNKKSDK